jgi:aspartyl-tRNA(Asn)/glutamyl-tRNA(Gln) amidotransferase subunit C
MALSKEEVIHIAKLARLHLEEGEITEYQEQLSSILDYVDALQSLDTTGVEEMQHVADLVNVVRADEESACDTDARARALENFSNKQDDLLEVQAVFENRSV